MDKQQLLDWFQWHFPKYHKEMIRSDHGFHGFGRIVLSPYHMEGDVWTHTKMVLDKAYYYNFDATVKAACLLHDIGKPFTREENHEKQRVSYFNHDGYGVFLAIDILNKLVELDYFKNVNIVNVLKMISWHQESFHISNKKNLLDFQHKFTFCDPEFVKQLNNLIQCDHEGRITKDKQEWSFPNIVFSKKPEKNVNKTVSILIGLPGSGKSTWVSNNNFKSHQIVSRDQIINDMYPNINYNSAFQQADQQQVDKILNEKFIQCNRQNDHFVIDMTNMSFKSRRKWVNQLNKKFVIKFVLFLVPIDVAIKRNAEREQKQLQNFVIHNMAENFKFPFESEYDEIEYVF